jgi:hypothetical protein
MSNVEFTKKATHSLKAVLLVAVGLAIFSVRAGQPEVAVPRDA